jgi:hypothetical protein
MSLALILKRHGEMVNLASSHFVTRNLGERLLDGLLTFSVCLTSGRRGVEEDHPGERDHKVSVPSTRLLGASQTDALGPCVLT